MTGSRHSTGYRIRQHPRRIREVLFSFCGILLFAGFIHRPFPLVLIAIGGLALTGAMIASSSLKTTIPALLGIGRLNRKVFYYTLPALALGVLLGILTRRRFELTLVPAGFTGVAILAPFIGAAEELLFRGYF